MIFFVAFMGVDAYMFNLSPPSWTAAFENTIFLQPLWLDILSTVMLAAILILVFVKPSRTTRKAKRR